MTARDRNRDAGILWRGNWATRTRIVTGLILFSFALFHFLNIGLGLFSPELMHGFQDLRQAITRSLAGEAILLAALLLHAGLALGKVATRRTLRMPAWEALQIGLGVAIPLLLIEHMVHTGVAHRVFGVNDRMDYIMSLIWGTPDGAWQALLLLIVWGHGCLGLHFWLRLKPWWRNASHWLAAGAALVPAFALAGFMVEGRRIRAEMADPETRAALFEWFNWPSPENFATLIRTATLADYVFWSILALVAAIYGGRKLVNRRRPVRIRYVDGPEITSARGPTLLEISQANGVPHTALCGGKGRCTTCRVVIEEGLDLLHPPSDMELASLRAVNAAPNTRLACQIRPSDPATVFRVFRPEGGRNRAHASQGQERQLAVLFLDMRGFTARTTGQLPYDVVFLLNRFFDAIVPSVTGAGGTVDKYLGDGFLAVFEARDADTSARAGIDAARSIGAALKLFNRTLAAEGAAPVRIGMGLHLGNLVLGEIGAGGHAPRTIIGDTVNAASRLEAETKALGVELLVSEAVLVAAGIETTGLDLQEFTLRGVPEPVRALPVSDAARLSLAATPAEQRSE
ncbi:adenylate/guanylate cyclase domain-containing protein [Ruegeria marina]|uniref:Adenylate/guanylate cyclase n=1 Tax=Ruegeria marina TaxID=639004 RepID=A0A1G6RQ48_9RHOB|nr:adenylate/guanylate cyclase domain-containing protein [Ruegeria marina]SDD06543.1 adenylate/guanylate cyclase [Ruegeria marina]